MNKYHAKKTAIDGIVFDSRKEAKRYTELIALQKEGKISGLTLQKEFELIPKQVVFVNGKKQTERACKYVADFVYMTAHGLVVEDVKGMKQRRPEYIIKRKLMLQRYGLSIQEV